MWTLAGGIRTSQAIPKSTLPQRLASRSQSIDSSMSVRRILEAQSMSSENPIETAKSGEGKGIVSNRIESCSRDTRNLRKSRDFQENFTNFAKIC